jgi:hypothetical protein
MTLSGCGTEALFEYIAVEVTFGVRKSLILRKPCRQPRRRMGVYTWNGDGSSTL